jgi:serine/threonine protein kinase
MLKRCGDSNSPPFTIFEAVDIMLQISEGVNYLHQKGFVHRDLKSLNILVKSVLAIQSKVEVGYVLAKVADFGLSKTKNFTTYSPQTSNTGTFRWMAPEVIALDEKSQGSTSSQPKYPAKCDVFSFAMLCYEILTGDVPFPCEILPRRVKEEIKNGNRPDLPDDCPHELKALIRECWSAMPKQRPSFPTICSKLKYLKYLLMTGKSHSSLLP